MALPPRTQYSLTYLFIEFPSSLQFQLAMQGSLASAVFCILVFSAVLHFVVGETRGSNVTFIGKSSNFSNANSWYDGEHAFLRDRYSPRDAILPPPDGKGPYCRQPAKCEYLNYTTCMGVKLPYASTTRDLVGDSSTQEQIQVCFFFAYVFFIFLLSNENHKIGHYHCLIHTF